MINMSELGEVEGEVCLNSNKKMKGAVASILKPTTISKYVGANYRRECWRK